MVTWCYVKIEDIVFNYDGNKCARGIRVNAEMMIVIVVIVISETG